ncbi:MAG TPA: SAM-dependent chlorinase/fluorinase [Chloroflexota bacterium]|nr:SAM-dependent chlorinase/fluorinase [Chloroflexota bacterium]
MAIVTLLTDFGLIDSYVAQMKAALLSVAPSVTLVDISHAVPPQDVRAGAFLLWTAVEPFPIGTVHLAVVDPGVGSSRLAVAARSARGDYFVGPDNGLLVPALERLGGIASAVSLLQTEFWRPPVSATFHGRDIFAPVAAHLASGVALEALGEPVAPRRPFELTFAEGMVCEVVHIDGYGNLITNLLAQQIQPPFQVQLGERRARFVPYYAAAEPGELIALVGSSGLLEISVRDGNAAALTGLSRGAPLELLPT